MRACLLTALLLACCLVLVNRIAAQTERVKFKFEVDGKQVNEQFKVLLYLDGRTIEPEMCGNSFTVPPDIEGRASVGVRFLSDKRDLYFDPVYVHDLKTDWIVGIDNKPFEKENISAERRYENVILIRYINFLPKDGSDGIRVTIEVYGNGSQQ